MPSLDDALHNIVGLNSRPRQWNQISGVGTSIRSLAPTIIAIHTCYTIITIHTGYNNKLPYILRQDSHSKT
jgi:hypothetical protein